MTMWKPDLAARSGPRYLAIAEALERDIAAGRLAPSTQLPTHRDLALALGVTVGTVSRGYAAAKQRGLITGEVGRGSYVRSAPTRDLPVDFRDMERGLVDFTLNIPPSAEGGAISARAAAALAKIAARTDLDAALGYQPPAGSKRHREAGARWIARTGLAAQAGNVLVCCGAQHAMTVLFSVLTQPGDTVLCEELTYPGMKALANLLHLRLQGIAMDADGVRPDAFASACRTRAARILYCIPTIQNPTTATMSETRRREIAEIATQHGVRIVEDDIHRSMLPDGPPTVTAFAPRLGFYVADTSKSILPGLRISYVLSPPEWVERLTIAVQATTWMASPLSAEIATSWIDDGTVDRIIAERRGEAEARQRIAREILGAFPYLAHPLGYHLWLSLPEPWHTERFVAEARRRGVGVTSAEAFMAGRGVAPSAVRLGLGAARDRAELERGLKVLADLLATPREAYQSIV